MKEKLPEITSGDKSGKTPLTCWYIVEIWKQKFYKPLQNLPAGIVEDNDFQIFREDDRVEEADLARSLLRYHGLWSAAWNCRSGYNAAFPKKRYPHEPSGCWKAWVCFTLKSVCSLSQTTGRNRQPNLYWRQMEGGCKDAMVEIRLWFSRKINCHAGKLCREMTRIFRRSYISQRKL